MTFNVYLQMVATVTRLLDGMTSDGTAVFVGTDGVPPPARRPNMRDASERTRALLTAPIFLTLLRLAAPMIAFMVVQAVVSTGEVYYVGFLGADALAGVAVSYPLVMLMTTMSAGGMGGGMASAVARRWGRGEQARPDGWPYTHW